MNKELLEKYYNGNCSEKEKLEVEEYLIGGDIRLFDEHTKILWEKAHNQIPESVSSRLKDKLNKNIGLDDNKIRTINLWRNIQKIAASVVIIGLMGIAFWKVRENGQVEPKATWTFTINDSDQIKMIKMPDGTSIWLNKGARLAYNNHFNQDFREVRLTGEAYFDVAHNPEKPFMVQTDKLTTTVLGTAFNIEAYPEESQIKIELVRGKVQVNKGKDPKYVLAPGEMLSYDKTNDNTSVETMQVKNAGMWTKGKLAFQQVPLLDALKRLEKNYHITIIYKGGKHEEITNITGVYEQSRPEDILQTIVFAANLKVKKTNQSTYIISNK